MAGSRVLLLTSDTQRRAAWHGATRDAGHLALPAPTLQRAVFLIHTVRPSLVLADVELEDGRILALLRHRRGTEPLARLSSSCLGT